MAPGAIRRDRRRCWQRGRPTFPVRARRRSGPGALRSEWRLPRPRMESTATWLSAVRSRTYSLRTPVLGSVLHLDYPDTLKSPGQLPRRIRLDLRLQIKQVAQGTGINEWTIINWEEERRVPRRRLPGETGRSRAAPTSPGRRCARPGGNGVPGGQCVCHSRPAGSPVEPARHPEGRPQEGWA